MILPIKHKVDWQLIGQKNQMHINKYDIRKNVKLVDHDYKVRDKVMLNNHSAYKNEIPHKGPFLITPCWTNDMVSL